MENYRLLSSPMKAVIDNVIENAISFTSDMRLDMEADGFEGMTVKDIRNQVLDSAVEFFAQELEPDGNADVHPHIVTCINERIGELSLGQLLGYIPLPRR